jgi:predicted DNA-binding protein (MmcQ/YjbR family)
VHHEEIRKYCLEKQGAEESFPFDQVTLVFKVGGKMFLLLSLDANPPQLNVKSEPARALDLREKYDWIKPGFHMNKTHWNTISCITGAPAKVIKSCIDDSYRLVFEGLPLKIQEKLSKK